MDNPKIKIELTTADKITEVAGYIALGLLWAIAIYIYNNTPDVVPVHFNLKGEADGYGDRKTVFFPAILCTFFMLIFTELNKRPEMMNLPVEITPQNAKRQYTLATRMMRWLKIILIVIFILIELYSYKSITADVSQYMAWLLALVGFLIVVPFGFYTLMGKRVK